MKDIDVIKKYAAVKGENDDYGKVFLDDLGELFIITFSGKKITDIAYQARNDKTYFDLVGDYVSLNYANCDKPSICQLGKPKPKCVKDGIYSKNKCAVVFLEKIFFDKCLMRLTIAEFNHLMDVEKINEL